MDQLNSLTDAQKARVFDAIIAHLEAARRDQRRRERARIEVALYHIKQWASKFAGGEG